MFCAASFKNLWCEPGYIPLKDEKRCRKLMILIKEESIDSGSDYNRLFHLHVVSSRLRTTDQQTFQQKPLQAVFFAIAK